MQHPLHGAGASGPKPDVHTLSTLKQKKNKNPQIELRRVCQMPQEIQKLCSCLCCFYIMFLTNFENWTDYCAFDDGHKRNHADMLWRVQAWDGESTNKCNSGGCIYLENVLSVGTLCSLPGTCTEPFAKMPWDTWDVLGQLQFEEINEKWHSAGRCEYFPVIFWMSFLCREMSQANGEKQSIIAVRWWTCMS